ncbi:hypothetical protein [Actinoplanes sp. NPDC051851]|uniref:hypothetical protein n=1 Tax=Actinoplanes sp. NPDC051851 TaxID=3154753 RepID=UPI003436F3D6
MDDQLLLYLRDDLSRRADAAAGQLSATAELLTAVRDLVGDRPGADQLRAAIAELTDAAGQLRPSR